MLPANSNSLLFDVEEVTGLKTLRHVHSPTSRVVIFIVTLKPSLRSIKHHVKCVMLYCDDRFFFRLMLKYLRDYCFVAIIST